MQYVFAAILGLVEGVTEFLPVSSTGHMILVEDLLRLEGKPGFADAFMVMIQLPAILAVVLYFWKRLWPFGAEADTRAIFGLWARVLTAFLPAAVIGFLLDDFIEARLFNPPTVAASLVAGGVVLLVIERRSIPVRHTDPALLGFRTALLIGFFQCLAMIPGTSRSAATIIGAMLLGVGRPAAAEFSFFLALPTMTGAAGLKLMENGLAFSAREWGLLFTGSAVSFVSAYAVVAAFMAYIRRRNFVPFAWYRIALGGAVTAWMLLR
ncbi:MAG: undecaprenyl-diphosphate phosphatase [Candidatus Hydrogenedentes bacterium]|nr:undecaprenyl-diphosphate phosphatase [Candidatus Hydrogenedentota bacterium]